MRFEGLLQVAHFPAIQESVQDVVCDGMYGGVTHDLDVSLTSASGQTSSS
jgi:hypothetical protein